MNSTVQLPAEYSNEVFNLYNFLYLSSYSHIYASFPENIALERVTLHPFSLSYNKLLVVYVSKYLLLLLAVQCKAYILS
jgi:hypothetical protein